VSEDQSAWVSIAINSTSWLRLICQTKRQTLCDIVSAQFHRIALAMAKSGLLRASEKVFCYLLPIRNILVPQVGQTPCVAGLPFSPYKQYGQPTPILMMTQLFASGHILLMGGN